MITDFGEIARINKHLTENYRVLDGRPIYRIVWSENQYEMRKGNWREFYGHILIREYTAVKRAPKYWYYNRPSWVLEKLVFINGHEALKTIVEELVEAQNGTYEPLYRFADKFENPLPVYERIVAVILWHLHNPQKKTASDLRA